MRIFEHTGLSNEEVIALRKKYGFNEVVEEEVLLWHRIIKKFVSPIPLMIEFALILSAVVKHWEDFWITFTLLAVNIVVDLAQEYKANKALVALTQTMAPTAMVLRSGSLERLPTRELVPGDVVKVAIGDIVPADLTLLDDEIITLDQSAITGESLPVEVTKDGKLLGSAIVQKGSGFAKVEAIGKKTVIGESANLMAVAEATEHSHFQTAILRIGRFLIVISICLVIVSSLYLLWRGDSLIETLRFAVVLIIASIPVALPAVLSVTMAIGASALAKQKAIVSDFKAVEELAGVDQLCIDKTGTLTKNAVEAYPPVLYNDATEAELYTYVTLALEDGNVTPVEKALFSHAVEHGYNQLANDYHVVDYIQFDPERKISEAIVQQGPRTMQVSMGAVQVIGGLVSEEEREKLEADVESYAGKGFRTIALAAGTKTNRTLVGLIPLMDPPRDDSKEVVSSIKKEGITIKMLTGDNHAIASFIGQQLEIGKRVLPITTLHKLFGKAYTNDAYKEISETSVFSEVVPADKYHIVETLQRHNHIVAMTGDGVNDAPALKKADVGIAVQGATAAARKAADLVLLDSSLSVIKRAVHLARETFARMQSYALFRISETIRIIFFVALSVLIYNYSPVSASMIVLLALLNDIPVLAISYDNVAKNNKPVRWHMREMLIVASVLGVLGVMSSFLLFYYLNMSGFEITVIQAIIFLKLDVAGHSTLYLTRTGRHHFWQKPYPALRFFLPAFSSRLIGTAIVYFGIFMPAISLTAIVLIWIYSTIWFVFNDFVKVWTYRVIDHYKLVSDKNSHN